MASSFAAEGFDVREVTLVDRYFHVADDDDNATISEAVARHIRSGQVKEAVKAFRSADLFVERVRLFKPSPRASVDIRQNGVILASGIETELVDKVLSRAFDAE